MKIKKWILGIVIMFQLVISDDKELQKVNYYNQMGNYPKSVELLENLITAEPGNYEYYLELGKIFGAMSMYNESVNCFQKVIDLDTTNLQAKIELGKAYKNCEKYNEAVITFTQILKEHKENIKVMKLLGELYFDNEQYAKAREIYAELSEIEFLHNIAQMNIGLCELKLGKIEEAVDILESVYKENPANFKTVILLNHAYTMANEYSQAEKLLNYELKKYPLNQKLLEAYSQILFRGKKFEMALEIFGKIQQNPVTDWDRYQKMGMCYYYIDKPKYAELMLTHSLRLDSTNYLSNYYMALTKMELEKWSDADTYFAKTIILSTPSFLAEAYMRKAICSEHLEKFDESLENYKLAQNFAPDRKEMGYYIATLIDMHFDNEKLALEKYQHFLENCDGCDVQMKNYAESRIDEIKEDQIFKGN